MDFINPVRISVADDTEWHGRISQKYPGYLDQLSASSPGAKIYFTAQPLFFDVTTDWATSLQKMVAGQVPVDEELDRLAEALSDRLKKAGIG
jgi:multiple sugar transport system substrate-binding protein